MDSPVRKQLKRNDYLRHKLFRKINRRKKAEKELAMNAPMKELRRRLRLKRTFKCGKDAYAGGKDAGIHIKPENRGKFTRLKKRTGKSASWFKAHGTPAQKKMATFELNARKWSK